MRSGLVQAKRWERTRASAPLIAFGITAIAMLMGMFAVATPAGAQEGTITCYAVADGDVGNDGLNNETVPDTLVRIDDALGAPTATIVGAIGAVTSTDAEAMAIRRGDATPIYAWETGLGLFTINPTTGVSQGAASFQVGNDKVEGLTWANTDDTDLTNDILYVILTNGDVIGYNDSGVVVDPATNPTTAQLDEGADVAWDPSTDTLYAIITANSDVSEVVVVSGAAGGGPTDLDMEGAGFELGGQMFGTTGNDGADALHTINKASGAAGLVIDLEGATSVFDHEDVDCIDLEFPPSDPGVITAAVTDSCVDDDGKITSTITYVSGDLPVDYSVVITGQADAVGTISSANSPVMAMVASLADGDYTVTVNDTTNNTQLATESVTIACDPAAPGVGAAVLSIECIDEDGKATLNLSYESGDLPIDYSVVITGQPAQTGTLDPNSTTAMAMFAGLADGDYTITATDTTNSVVLVSETANVSCDPVLVAGVISASVAVACVDDAGKVTATITYTSGDLAVDWSATIGSEPAQTGTITADNSPVMAMAANLDDGTYLVTVNDTTNNTLVLSETVSVVDCAPPVPGTVMGNVWDDADEDGQEGPAPVGVGGVTVNLWSTTPAGAPNEIVMTTVTADSTGKYSFAEVIPGNYIVQVVADGGSTFTAQNTGDDATDSDVNADGLTDLIVLADGQMIINVDAGLVPPPGMVVTDLSHGCLGGNGIIRFKVTNDTNADVLATLAVEGLSDRTLTVPANSMVTVARSGRADGTYAVDALIDGVSIGAQNIVINCDPDEVVVDLATVCVAGNGLIRYRVTNGTGSAVEATLQVPGLSDKTTTVPANSAITISRSGRRDGSYAVVGLINGQPAITRTEVVACDDPGQGGITIGNRVWNDIDGDGIQEINQNGLIGLTVNLWSVDGNGAPSGIIQTTTTAAAGLYSFTGVMPGDYRVQVVAPDGYIFTAQNVGPELTDSDFDSAGISDLLTVIAGQTNNALDAGLLLDGGPGPLSTIGNRVWFDTDGDGLQEINQNGATNVTVNLWSVDANGAPAAIVDTTTTGAGGIYSFTNVSAGDYRVQVIAPAGYEFTAQNSGGPDTTDSDFDSAGISDLVTLTGNTNNTVDAGLVADGDPGAGDTAVIGNRVWFDTDGDGVQEANQNGVIGATVNLWSVNAAGDAVAVIGTTQTGAGGVYQFTGLAGGSYRVQVIAPAGYVFTAQNSPGSDLLDSDVDSGGISDLINLAAGETNNTIDAGVVSASAGEFTYSVVGECGRIKLTFNNGSDQAVNWSYDVVEVTMHPLVTGSSAPGEMTMKAVTGRRPGTYTVNVTVDGVLMTETVVVSC